MTQLYPHIKWLHILCVSLSGSLFALRGVLVLSGSAWGNHVALRRLSYAIDTVLLLAAIWLTTLVHQYPLLNGWLTMKVLLLAAYVVLGVFALRRGRTQRQKLLCFIAALAVFLYMVSVARAHSPWGVFAALIS